jgi:hypothetical protein
MKPSAHALKHSANSRTAIHRQALLRLLKARECSSKLDQDIWQFAVQLAEFRAEHIPDTVLRELVAEGLVAHAEEITKRTSGRRQVIQVPHHHFSDQSCFILTDAGLPAARASVDNDSEQISGLLPSVTANEEPPQVVPAFLQCDDGRRELRWQAHIVKRFKCPPSRNACHFSWINR